MFAFIGWSLAIILLWILLGVGHVAENMFSNNKMDSLKSKIILFPITIIMKALNNVYCR